MRLLVFCANSRRKCLDLPFFALRPRLPSPSVPETQFGLKIKQKGKTTILRKTQLPRISPSSVGDLDCLKKFHTLRILGQWPTDGDSTFNYSAQFGNAVHQVLRSVYDPQLGIPPHHRGIALFAQEAFYEATYERNADRLADIERCIDIVRQYVRTDDEDDAIGTIAVEQECQFDIDINGAPSFALTAKPDRLIVRGDDLVIRDYKLGRRKVDLAEAFVQIWAAKLKYHGYKLYSVEIDWIDGNGNVQRDVLPQLAFRGMAQLIKAKVMRVLTASEYPPEPGEVCRYCKLRAFCQPNATASLDSLDKLFGDADEEVSE